VINLFNKGDKNYIKIELEKWKKKYPEKEIPKKLSKKQRKKWLEEVYLANEGKETVISGGGRILLWFALLGRREKPLAKRERSWKRHLLEMEKKGHIENYIEVLKFRHREKMLGTHLLRDVPKKNINDLIESD